MLERINIHVIRYESNKLRDVEIWFTPHIPSKRRHVRSTTIVRCCELRSHLLEPQSTSSSLTSSLNFSRSCAYENNVLAFSSSCTYVFYYFFYGSKIILARNFTLCSKNIINHTMLHAVSRAPMMSFSSMHLHHFLVLTSDKGVC